MASKSTWRDFERLVAVIEAEAAPRGATVRSPDRIRDRVTGRMREVDASIRFLAGTTEILVTIECRRRNRRADDTWVEQLATKKQKIGAAKTIAVSSRGFTASAKASAEHHGIELRTLSEIEPKDVGNWFLPHGVVHLFRKVNKLRCLVRLEGRDDYLEVRDPMKPCFVHDLVVVPFPAVAFLNFIEMKEPKRFWSVPLDGTITRLDFDLDAMAPDLIPVPLGVAAPERCRLTLQLAGDTGAVRRIRLSADISYEVASFESEQGRHHLYQAPSGMVAQHSRFTGEVFGFPVTFDHQLVRSGAPSASVEFPSGLRLPSSWFGVGSDTLEVLARIRRQAPTTVACGLCSRRTPMAPRSVVPEYLFPENAVIPKEPLLCSTCAEKVAVWDDYGRIALSAFPENLPTAENAYISVERVDYDRLRLWLLSLLWRMSIASGPTWGNVILTGEADRLTTLLAENNPGGPAEYPVGCVVPIFDGQRLDFLLQPDSVEVAGGRLVRAILGGVLFMFSPTAVAKEDQLEPFHVRPGLPWLVPVIDWKRIDFLKHWIDSNFIMRREAEDAGAKEDA